MASYEYIVARYTPNPVKDEPRNIGIIVFDKSTMKAIGEFVGDDYLTKIKEENPDANVKALNTILDIYRGEQVVDDEKYLDDIANSVVKSLHFKNVCVKDSEDHTKAVEELFQEYISVKPKQVAA